MNERDPNRNDPDMVDDLSDRQDVPRERVGGKSDEDVRGIGDEQDELEDAEDEDLDEDEDDKA